MAKTIHQQKHHNLLMLFIGLALAIFLSKSQFFNQFLGNLGQFGFLSAIIAGAMFVCTFTVATGALVIFNLAKTMSPVELILFGMIGAVIFDMLIYKTIKNTVDVEIKEAFSNPKFSHFKKILHTKYFAWMAPLIGLFVFLSPLPDELGISLLGLSKLKTYQFFFLSLINHTLGMFLVVSAVNLL